MEKKLAGWKGGALSIEGRVTLLNACLSATPVYHLSMHRVPKTNLEKLDKIRRKFVWQGGSLKRKYHLVKWQLICKPKIRGGLGVKNLELFNISLLYKWWWKLEAESGICQSIHNIKGKQSDSPGGKDLLHIRELYLKGRVMIVGNGRRTDFWGDSWCGHTPLKDQFLSLFSTSDAIGCSVADIVARRWRLTFRRWLD